MAEPSRTEGFASHQCKGAKPKASWDVLKAQPILFLWTTSKPYKREIRSLMQAAIDVQLLKEQLEIVRNLELAIVGAQTRRSWRLWFSW